MPNTKVNFSEEELKTMANSRFFAVKQSVTKKVYTLFGTLKKDLQHTPAHRRFDFPKGTDLSSGKISRGENYRNLPFVMLDYPRRFSRESVFAFRSLFWWGHYFSFTWHLQYEGLTRYQSKLNANIHRLAGQGFYLSVGDTPWDYTYDPTNYRLLDELSTQARHTSIMDKDFVKLSRCLPLDDYIEVLPFARETYGQVLEVLA